MDRQEAMQALELLRRVVSQTRDDTVMQNWGLIWIIQGTINCAGFMATNVLYWRRTPAWVFPTLWLCIVAVDLAINFALKTRTAGTRSFVESQIYSIWLIFFASANLVGLINHLMGLEIFLMGPILAVLAASSLAVMATIMGKKFFASALAAALAAVLMALFREWQFVILGAVWGSFQVGVGMIFHRERLRRLALSAGEARLV